MSPYIPMLNRLWELDELYSWQEKEVTLYTYLLRLANTGRWTTLSIPLKDVTVREKFGWGKDAFSAARLRLTTAQLITFTPGNGRGKSAQYTLVIPEKVAAIRTLYDQKGDLIKAPLGDKGALIKDPLQPKGDLNSTPLGPKGDLNKAPFARPDFGKVRIKVTAIRTLYEPNAATSADSRGPKILIDVSLEPKGSKGGLNADARPKSGGSGKKKQTGDPGKKREPSGLYQKCIEAYQVWFIGRTVSEENPEGNKPLIDEVQGSHMKGIIQYLRTQVMHRADTRNETITAEEQETRILDAWQNILDYHHLLRAWLGQRTRLQDFRTEIQNILIAVRDAIVNERKQQQAAGNSQQSTAGRTSAANQRGGGSVGGLQGLKLD